MGVLREGRPARNEQARDRVADQGRRARLAGKTRPALRGGRQGYGARAEGAERRGARSAGFSVCSTKRPRTARRTATICPRFRTGRKSERLANEKEVLGFFVSGHPLDKYAEKIKNLSGIIPTAEALERKPPERRWGKESDPAGRNSGRRHDAGISACRRAKREGKLYAMGRLRMRPAKIDLICFARDYERLTEQLKIRGAGLTARHADGRRRLSAQDLRQRDSASRRCPGEAADAACESASAWTAPRTSCSPG